ncbi:MAG: response regulator, partial [Desulfohalobiaceae bacterium]|nr:response regulator [Desulfohalobiaceae bacterium]
LLGVLGLVLLSGTGVIFWGNTRRLLLQTRLDTEAKSRAQIEGMNQQLEQRVKDRTTELERSYLQLQQENEERLKAVEEQRVLEKRMARMIEAAPIGICIHQKEQLVYVNPACVRMFGYNQDSEMLGLQPEDLIAQEDLETIFAPTAKILPAEQGPAHYKVKGLKAGGEQFEAVLRTTRIDFEGHKALLGFVVDISEEERLRRQFLQAQKMEAVGRLAGGVAHDFNNLLTVILGCAEQVMFALETDSPIYQDAQEIKQAGERAASLTRQLLAFSRKQILEPKVLCLNDVLQDLQKMLGRLIGEDVELRVNPVSDVGLVRIDQGQLEQVLMNLAVNARDAMPEGGCLSIATCNAVIEPDSTQFNGVRVPAGDYVRLEVSDTGVGMSEETRSRIFEPFFTTKELGKGTGLGLATVYGIVKQSNGFIFCSSQPEQGTTFTLYFPLIDEDPPAEKAQSIHAAVNSGSETILLVEDDAGLRKVAGKVLKSKGYTVLSASNEQEALASCEAQSCQIHLLLSDVVLPGMNGVELEQQVRARRPEIKRLFMSGYAGEALEEMDLSIARTCFLKKPFTPEELCRRVREVLDS